PRAVELLGYRWPGQSPKGGGDDLARATPQKDSGRHASRWRGRCANRGPKSPCDDRAATKYGRTWDNAISLHGRAKESPDTIGASLLYPSGLEFKARSILSNDFLTPLVRAFLFVDFFQNFLPYPIGPLDRARALEESFATAWRASGSTDPGAFDRDFREAWDPREKSPAPALVLNTTNVSTGERVVIAPFRIDSRAGLVHFPIPESPATGAPISLSTAVVLSARFPWITPAGWIDAYPIVGGDQNSDGSTVASNNGRTPGLSKLQLQLVDG